VLEAAGISKSYGGVRALEAAGLTVRSGSVHALLGENGAGKSTLVKVVAGALAPDAGTLRLDGREVAFASTADAARHGVAVVSQDLSLFEDLDVLANLFPMREPRRGPFVSRAEMARRARPVLAELGLDVPLRRRVGALTLAQRQLVEVARALVTEPRVLILDEPTSALGVKQSGIVLRYIVQARERGVGVIFISHNPHHAHPVGDRFVILNRGKLQGSWKRGEISRDELVQMMAGGAELDQLTHELRQELGHKAE
jgi:ABC-type sugar transport system ATPase subunit